MKHPSRKISATLLGLSMGMSLFAQSAYKGQLYINSEKFSLQGELLRVQLRVSYDDDILNTGETLNFTPVLKSGQYMKPLSSVVINGSERGKYEGRSASFDKRLRQSIPVVTADRRHGTRYFVYDTTIPYSDWMSAAALYVESEERGWGKRPQVYEDKVFSSINIQRVAGSSDDDAQRKGSSLRGTAARSEWIHFLNPSQAVSSRITVSGMIPLYDERMIGKMGTGKFNKAVYADINGELESYLNVPGTVVRNLQVVGYGSPKGNYKANETRSSERALKLKKFLMNNRILGSDGLTVTWVPEDWDSISTLVGKSQMKLKNAVLDVIKTVPVVKGREDEIKVLGDGSPYSYMQNYIFPNVERIKYFVTLERQAGSGVGTVNNDAHTVSLNNMFATAQSFKVGSREYNDIVDLMARLFPDNAEANIDAAGVALMRGDLELADKYLKPWGTDPRAYCNLGVLNMLRGDFHKAEVYLQMAEAAGVKEATNALNYLNNVHK